MWEASRQSRSVRHDSFEPILATLAFVLWINVFRLADLYGGPYGLHQWKLRGPPCTDRDFQGQHPLEVLLKPGHSVLAALLFLAPLFLIDTLYPRRKLPVEPPTSAGLLGGVASSLFLYDFLFFWIHVALHRSSWLYRYVHATHHQQLVLTSGEVVHHNLVDGVLQVGTNVVVLNTLGLHPLTRALHNVTVTYLLTESHSGYDAPWMLHNIVPFGLIGGPPAHEAHHIHGHTHFHQFLTWLDWLPPALDGVMRSKRILPPVVVR